MDRVDEAAGQLAGTSAPGIMDWGVGRYETTAAQLLPTASVVVQEATLRSGERVLDVGCGTGNAALLAAGEGVDVTGVDPAWRLLEVARARAASEGKDITFLHGEAASLPVDNASTDVALSVFGVIFAPDPGAAAAEISRALVPGGRIVLSAWVPTGAIFEMRALAAETVRQAAGAPSVPEPFAWYDHDALSALLGPHGFRVEVHQHSLAFEASSVQEFLAESEKHPMAVAGRRVLEPLGQADALQDRLLEILDNRNEDRDSFRVTSQYIVAIGRR